ncbi:MAG: abortive infection system antitoxin AbiGi family protein [Candidatus Thiodiazotropha taylori]|nr:abortive infection system antitoxin AbiGi family protein [Candidatus Thiodiazotropha taylori]
MDDNLIIHITKSFDILKSILQSTSLRLAYSKERFCIGSKVVSNAAHPMVCFSEYNINELSTKTITYGKYGIAFTKAWACKNRISPVLYIDSNSIAADGLATLLRARRHKETSRMNSKVKRSIMEIKCFTKNIRGRNTYLKINNFDFRSENEWRYVPRKPDIGNNYISESLRTYLKNQKRYNDRLIPYPLKFKYDDIAMLFVSDENERIQIEEMHPAISSRIRVSEWET